eukprot:4470340-Prorocentrum_lima.AAC.1
MVVQVVEGKLMMHEEPYLENKLKKRGLCAPNFGKESLPEPQVTLPTRKQRNTTVQGRAEESKHNLK